MNDEHDLCFNLRTKIDQGLFFGLLSSILVFGMAIGYALS